MKQHPASAGLTEQRGKECETVRTKIMKLLKEFHGPCQALRVICISTGTSM